MQSYQEYLVSEFLSARQPYIEPPFTSEIDTKQVTLSVFFRKIHKLAECLATEDLTDSLKADALHTLNELISHQETKDTAVGAGLLHSCAQLLTSAQPIVRKEAALLIGGMSTLLRGRESMTSSGAFPALCTCLDDSHREVRESVSWALCRVSFSRDGVDRLIETNTIPTMVQAFLKYAASPSLSDKQFLLCLLECFVNVTAYDEGIVPVLGTGFLKCLIELLGGLHCFEVPGQGVNPATVMAEKTLYAICHITLNPEGKHEGTEHGAIAAASEYLQENYTQEQQRVASAVIMSVTITLEGKRQAIHAPAGQKPEVLLRLYRILQRAQPSSRVNAKQVFHNLTELPAAFDKSVDILSEDLGLLDEVHACKAIKPLVRLLPKLNTYKNPPELESAGLSDYQRYIAAIHCIVGKYTTAENELNDTVNIAEKLGPFLQEGSGVSERVAEILEKVCAKDQGAREALRGFLRTYRLERELVRHPHLNELIYE